MNPTYTSATELAADESFINWVKQGQGEESRAWQHWLQAHPDQQYLVEEARNLVHMLSQDEDQLQAWELNQIWQELTLARQQNPPAGEARIISFPIFRSRVAAAAAGVLALAGGFALYQYYFPSPVVYATTYGERRTIQLPDHSTVMLNANSKISVPARWDSGETREVELEGEAFFSVRHTARHQKFRVLTPDGIEVEVLGTEFGVSDRGAVSRVVLASGKVQVRVAAGPGAPREKQVVMRPGQMVEVSEQTRQLTKKAVNPERYLAWTHNKLIFDNTSLGEIARMVSQDYGYQVVFADKSLAALRITASFEVTGLDSLLETLSETFNIRIDKQKQKIIFSKPTIIQSHKSNTYAK